MKTPPWLPFCLATRVNYGVMAILVVVVAALGGLPWWVNFIYVGVLGVCSYWICMPKRWYLVAWLDWHGRESDDKAVGWWLTYEVMWRQQKKGKLVP